MAIIYRKLWKELIYRDLKKDLRITERISTNTLEKIGTSDRTLTNVLEKICLTLNCNAGCIRIMPNCI